MQLFSLAMQPVVYVHVCNACVLSVYLIHSNFALVLYIATTYTFIYSFCICAVSTVLCRPSAIIYSVDCGLV